MLGVYLVAYAGQVLEATVTNDASIIQYWLHKNAVVSNEERHVIDLASRWGPHHQTLSTLHVCVGTKCLLLHLHRTERHVVSQALEAFFNDPRNAFVGVEADETVAALRRQFGLRCAVVDARALARRRFPFSLGASIGLKPLAWRLLNLRRWKPSKALAGEAFECAKLDGESVKIACVDAYVLRRIGLKLLQWTD